MVPAFFRSVPPSSDLATSCWKAHCWLVQAVYEEMVHLSRYLGTRVVVSGDGKPPHFCLECRCRAFTNLQSIRLAAISRPLSRCYPLLYRPALLHLLCADGISSAQWTICVPCLLLQTLRREDERKGGRTAHSITHQGRTAESGCRHSAEGRRQEASRSWGLLSL
jgi:hypothetical protein